MKEKKPLVYFSPRASFPSRVFIVVYRAERNEERRRGKEIKVFLRPDTDRDIHKMLPSVRSSASAYTHARAFKVLKTGRKSQSGREDQPADHPDFPAAVA